MCLFDLPTMPGHAPDEAGDVFLRDLLPEQSTPGQSVVLVDGSRHDVPDVLDWIQVWGTDRPVHSINAFILQELLTHFSRMRPSIVMHKKEPRAHCTSIWAHNGSDDLIPVSNGSQGTSG